jgi:poly-gamma-glutamate synthesis protein (capsule biosynthesis protein)
MTEWFMHMVSVSTAFLVGLISALGSSPVYSALSFPQAGSPQASIIFGGDMMFDRTIRATIDQKGADFIFSCIDPVLRRADMVVANLEGPITSTSSVSVGSAVGGEGNYTFTFATSTVELLYRHNIRLVNIGNNHIMNFSRWGLEQTKEYLQESGVQYFGDPAAPEAERVARIYIGGIPFSFVNWSDWTSDKTDHTVAQVRQEARSGRVVVVYTHWGEEYMPTLPRTKQLAHDFVDAGAAIVVGSHPHVVQEPEVYRGKSIYYSLGNFVFDQYWNEDVRTGLLLRVSFSSSGVRSVEEISVHLERDRTTCPKQ